MPTGAQKQAAAEVLAKAKAKTSRVSIVLDGDLLDEHEQLEEELKALGEGHPEAADIAERILAVEEAMAAAEVQFVFKGIGRGRWRKMTADFPPSEEHKAAGAEFDAAEFPFHAMAASLTSPEMTVEQLKELEDEVLTEAQFMSLWGACIRANLGGHSHVPSSQAARRVLNGHGNSARPSDSE